jgi:Uma2 family endonuclease
MLKKARFYQQNGVNTVWVINDDPLEIHVFEGKDRYVVRAGEKLEAPVVLPGFSLAASELLIPAA